jgi:hypothetical protein
VTSRRVALKPFTFSDGTRVEKGDWTYVPLRAMLYDPIRYPHPDTFNGFRFTDLPKSDLVPFTQPEGPSKLTDVSHNWGMWGISRMAWYVVPRQSHPFPACNARADMIHWCFSPARFHSGVVIKLILAHFLANYEFELADKNTSLSSTWRSYLFPREDLMVMLKPRKQATT